MASQNNNQIATAIFQMLFELATGNYRFRKEMPAEENLFTKEIELLNHFANLWEEKIIHLHFPTPFYSFQSSIQHTVIINTKGQIQYLSPSFAFHLNYKPIELKETPIYQLLHKNSTDLLHNEINQLSESTIIHLIFVTTDNLYLPHFCSLLKLYPSELISINLITTMFQNIEDNNHLTTNPPAEPDDTILFNKIYNFISKNTEEQLPSTKEIAKQFGVNESKLKQGFKAHFNTSIYQCYNDIRLKKAFDLIQNTTLQIKEIAYSCGFNDYVTFSKAFKKKFGFAPANLKRPE
ncbi:helix-turn-helix domain-containing protein [Flavobacterium capsici]|uniref:Helix-turn-helix domain-containing protein n=1 Tax=Flavobacterium capsici TaxID=3075618 RepID=A0AA96EWH5_9FLAO|nr:MULTISPECIES: helix-turn-helix domain-containing protein [unclassified Flavobacterium]WNM19476.1 helix-turn-helix domain-containing protein [Flavobacterium sp. PMR2A8]WNM20865.1 helix-turn-helix domain-containing protein [Flavobacterium sp. PMTSA4]